MTTKKTLLQIIDEIIDKKFKYHNNNQLIETIKIKNVIEEQKVFLKKTGKSFIYKFDVANTENSGIDIFPIFNKKLKNLCCISDYIIFYPTEKKFFIFLCEFKSQSTSGAVNQIHSSKALSQYIVKIAIRHSKFLLNKESIEYRGLVFTKDNRASKPLINVKNQIKEK